MAEGRRRRNPLGRLARSDRFRQVVGRARILPAFLIIGAQRAGTTTLFEQLLDHPDVYGPLSSPGELTWTRKEIHFFDERWLLGPAWYRSFFPLRASRALRRLRGGDIVAGEATPYYMFHPLVPERVAQTIPDLRLIALLRDPVARAYSHYRMMVRSKREELPFPEALATEKERLASGAELDAGTTRFRIGTGERRKHYHHRHHSYFARGLYADQLERWLEHFPRDQLLVLEAEAMFARPAETYAEVLAFLRVGPRKLERASLTRNRASYEPLDRDFEAALRKRYEEPNARLARLLGWPQAWGVPAAQSGELGLDGGRGDGA